MNGKALVVHSGMQHAEHVAIAYKRAGQLYAFATGSLFPYDPRVERIASANGVLHRMYLNRSTRQLSRAEVISVSRYEAAERIAWKFTRSHDRGRAITHWRDRVMSRHFARRLPDGIGKVYSFPNVALDLFERARDRGARLLLDLPIGHFNRAIAIAAEERARFPDLAGTFTYDAPPEEFARRFRQELDLADVLVCGSRFVRDSFIAEGVAPDKLQLVRYGSSLAPVTPEERAARMARLDGADRPLRVVFVGQFSQRKGLGYLLDAIRAAKRREPRLHLTMIGSFVGPRDWLDRNRDLVDEVVIRASREKVRQHLNAADVFFFPSLFEGSALSIHEAAALGVPVVTTVNSGADFVADRGIGEVHEIRDSARHADTLVRLAQDRAYLRTLTVRAIETSAEATWDAFYDRLPTL